MVHHVMQLGDLLADALMVRQCEQPALGSRYHAVGLARAMQQQGEGRSFGSLLRSYRTNAGLTQEELAERAGLSRRGIADLERGARRAPYAHTLAQLRTALDLSEAEHAALVDAARQQAIVNRQSMAMSQTEQSA